MSNESDDRNIALAINTASYDDREEHRILDGSPHLKHASLRKIHQGLVQEIASSHAEGLSVLELGAGDGLATTPWFATRARVTAVDCSAEMLARLTRRAATHHCEVTTILADAEEFITGCTEQYDAVCFISMLHHVPDYMALLRLALKTVRPGGDILTFQDPLRYDAMPPLQHAADRMTYFAWRLGQGNLRRGLKTRLRRLRGIYSADEAVDFEEYHVVRNGVDSEAIVKQLSTAFEGVRLIRYWSSLGSPWQLFGERLHYRNTFGILARGRLASP